MANAGIELRNEKPYGIVIPSKGGVEIVGEEEHQDKLNEYGAGAWFSGANSNEEKTRKAPTWENPPSSSPSTANKSDG